MTNWAINKNCCLNNWNSTTSYSSQKFYGAPNNVPQFIHLSGVNSYITQGISFNVAGYYDLVFYYAKQNSHLLKVQVILQVIYSVDMKTLLPAAVSALAEAAAATLIVR